MTKTIFILGATGFIGRELLTEALAAGWRVKALARSSESAAALTQAGAQAILGDAQHPQTWITETADATALIDLVQPKLPGRITRSVIQTISKYRQTVTGNLIHALQSLPVDQRPLLFSISGADDLQPNAQNTIGQGDSLRAQPRGFGHIGIPVRRLLEASELEVAYIYFGNFVYGPGKGFAEQVAPGLAAGRLPVIGQGLNRLPMVHVTDAARAVVHLAGLEHSACVGRTWVVADGAGTTLREFFNHIADLIGARHPIVIPTWLASLVTGAIAVETLTLDVQVDSSALAQTGFRFQYPSPQKGLPPTLARLGYNPLTATSI